MNRSSHRGAWREHLGGSLWAMPTAAIGASLIAGLVLSRIELDPDSALGGVIFEGDVSAARELLTIVSATMITTTGLVFSLTVVALQIASGQYSPRLLRNFLRDRGTQVVLSIFVATFTYATAGLHTVGTTRDGEVFVPHLAVTAALALTFLSVVAFVWYLHHLAHSLQIDSVMRIVERRTLDVIHHPDDRVQGDAMPPIPDHAEPAPAPASGYIQAAFPNVVVPDATRLGVTVRYLNCVGDFVTEGSPLAAVWCSDGGPVPPAALELPGRGMRVDFERTFEQDTAFGVNQLLDVSLRAVSPAINDPYTAVQAVQHLTVIFCEILRSRRRPDLYRDAAGELRVAVPWPSLGEQLSLVCGHLRRVAGHEPRVVSALLRMLAHVGYRTDDPVDRAAIQREADLLIATARERLIPEDLDLVDAAAAMLWRRIPARR